MGFALKGKIAQYFFYPEAFWKLFFSPPAGR
jgi:hypothetical protein